ncbi:aldehyde dehydrogenase family protein [Actinoplanes sp. NPDC051851]|uniref:aldehyde dehydrogenase family protein n=1 Tax=Actinoplanes sp. NPDC051851 TaxID=3154753 RepID=UPI00342B4129
MAVTAVYELPDIHKVLRDGCHLIDGAWAPARSGATIDVLDPSNGTLLARVARGDAPDVADAVTAAQAALPAWRDTSPAERGELLYRWAELTLEYDEVINVLQAAEVGHPVGPSPIAARLKYLAGKADKVLGRTLPTRSPDLLGLTLREPYGVVGAIIPWNVPGPFTVFNTAPAMAAGNTVILKPAEDAPLTALFLAWLALEAGIPPGVLNVVTGYGAEAGAALPAHPGVRKMAFTGSPATGAAVMAACARNLIPLQLELGGKSPQILFPDADLNRALPAIVASITANAGQVCAAGSRLLVPDSLHETVVAEIARRFAALRIGAWTTPADMGPLINAVQERRVLDYIAAGSAEGADLVHGGHKLEGDAYDRGFFVEPTLFDGVRPGMRIAQEEIFGPVLSVLPYRDGDEDSAIDIANGTRYGLTATVWTRDLGRAVRVARRIEAGQVAINVVGDGGPRGAIGAPFGGYKDSGFGRSMGPDFVEDWTQEKALIIDAAV